MKRALALLLCLLLLFAVGCQEENAPDKDSPSDSVEIITEDGLRRVNGRKIDNIYLADGKLHYTFVNQTNLDSGCGPYSVTVEKWVDEEWCYYPLLSGVSREVALALPAHQEHSTSRTLHPQAVTPGKYRLVEGYEMFSTNIDGTTRVTRSDEYTYWIGYFTITEEQAAEYPDLPEDIYYDAGAYQSKNVTLSISNVENEPHHAEFSLQNNGNKNLIIPISNNKTYHEGDPIIKQNAWMQRWNEEKGYYEHCHWWQRLPEADTVIAPGEALRLPLCSDEPRTLEDRYEMEDGYYSYFITCYWEGDTGNVFSAVIFFRITNGIIS